MRDLVMQRCGQLVNIVWADIYHAILQKWRAIAADGVTADLKQ